MSVVKKFVGTQTSIVPKTPTAQNLPSTLIVSPGQYIFDGQSYDCMEEGLYVFWQPMGTTQNRIVYNNDVEALISSLSYLSVNGKADEPLTVAQKTTHAMTSKVRALCGLSVDWVISVLNGKGVQCRKVRCLTSETPTNYYDGHVMVEAKINGNWKLFDISNNTAFVDQAGEILPLKDALPLNASTVFKKISTGPNYAIEPHTPSAFDVTAWCETTMGSPQEWENEIKRVLQIPGIVQPDLHTYFCIPTGMEQASSYVTSLSTAYHVMDETTWLSTFYP